MRVGYGECLGLKKLKGESNLRGVSCFRTEEARASIEYLPNSRPENGMAEHPRVQGFRRLRELRCCQGTLFKLLYGGNLMIYHMYP